MDEQELDLREIFSVLKRRLWLLLLLPIVAAVTAGVVSFYVLAPVYSASTTLWVIKDNSTGAMQYQDLLFNQNLTKTYAEVAKSRAVVDSAIRRLKLTGTTVEELQKQLTVSTVRDTQLLSFTVEDSKPERAARLADGLAEAFMAEISGFMKIENVKIVDRALIPTDPIKPRKMMNVAIAFVLGLMAAVGLAFLMEYLDTSLKTPEDVTRHLGLPVLGSIPHFEGYAAEATAAPGRTRSRSRDRKEAGQE